MAQTSPTYLNYVLALIKGDDAEAQSIKVQRKAKAALTAQIAVKKAHTLTLEEDVEQAEEALKLARANSGNTNLVSDSYIRELLLKRKTLKAVLKTLNDHLEDIEFLEQELGIVKK